VSASDITPLVRAFIAEEFGVPANQEIGDDESLLGGGFVDSMGILALIDFIESDLGVAVGEDDLVATNFESIAAIREFVEGKRRHEASAA
jgi:acyl carrier protein